MTSKDLGSAELIADKIDEYLQEFVDNFKIQDESGESDETVCSNYDIKCNYFNENPSKKDVEWTGEAGNI